MATKEGEMRKEDEVGKLRHKCDELQIKYNGAMLKIMALETRLSVEVRKNVELEVEVIQLKEDKPVCSKCYTNELENE